ncbi:MAG TPA: preprotein translocase subunit SecG [Rhodobiaceae bacterium]|nr:MAG: Protein-export membrane protein SecG [Rhodobiaceae bacterium UBA7378]HCQ82315.1 preprotein translocase subunit SecG [Rhodobiaceae bacterium]|tara:strand:+ start:2340 stop:2684 length:345 start_codon:yes stop_codon:yes gene_type:complete
MSTILLVVHLMIALAMIVLVLLQRSEGGALGIGGGGGGDGLMSGRGIGNALTRTTGILAGLFFLTSIGLTVLGSMENRSSVLDGVGGGNDSPLQAPAPALPVPVAPAPALPTPQ